MSLPCIIIGASHAAVQLSFNLRQQGWQHDIIIIGNESHMPYQKPPLSKSIMSQQKSLEEILLKKDEFYQDANIRLMLNTNVTEIDRSTKTIKLANGEVLAYSKLALCTGAIANKISLSDKPLLGVHYLRTAGDAAKIQNQLTHAKNAVIIGGGFIGLELAAAFNQLGVHVTIIEAQENILQRVVTSEVAQFISSLHQQHGVEIKNCCIAKRLTGDAYVSAVVCESGESIPADLVIIGIGITPVTTLATKANLDVDNGILINQFAVTSDPNIVAAGDCCSYFHSIYQRNVRVESIQNALDQAKSAAASIMGKEIDFSHNIPRFWSDQYDIKLQMCGLIDGYDNVEVINPQDHGQLSVLYRKDNKLIAAVIINNPLMMKQAISAIANQEAFIH